MLPSVGTASAASAKPLEEAPERSRQRDPWRVVRRPGDRLAEILIHLLAGTAIVAVALIFLFVAKEALPLFFSEEVMKEVTLAKMWFAQQWPGYDAAEHVWQPISEVPKYGLWPLIIGSVKVTLVAMLIATPLGVGAAVWVAEFARPRLRSWLKPIVELMAGIPSVVLGFFALIVLATWLQDTFDLDSRLSALLAGIGLSFALIPIIFTMADEALRAVPRSYVEASTALGARRYQTVLQVLLPAAAPGIFAGLALAFGRAIGETMIVLMASGNAAIVSASLLDSTRTLPATVAAELAEVVFGGAHYTVLFFIGALLFVLTFAVNLAGGAIIERMKLRLGVKR
ncbi:MAG: phosphate ABC transporter permease subunit PstC [Myxococcota bacterium]